ncbi:hypothetical protein PVAND_005173 [Polypedilum vanderplanki]|uniref:Choline/carnitine acyltransferase domain-containing protein n=1 Tax=Polypedilum vanderplanki TaxID=319348 RepID=A0A9J6BZT3_POLVA|nr:hypothetical protein PVAND_005173 [Polypedilum vanderplanki]
MKNQQITNLRHLGILSRESQYILPDGSPSTFSRDESLEKLPLPKLEDTLERYYKNLLPFGDENELKNSRKIIEEFKNGVGKELHKMLEEKAAKEKNWVRKFWEDYAYLEYRTPLAPFSVQIQPIMLQSIGIEESKKDCLKNFARIVHYFGVYFQILREEKLRPTTNPDGSVVFSSNQFKRLYNTSRIPGEIKDEIFNCFKTKTEGECPSTIVVIGKGRIFYFDIIQNNKLLSPAELLHTFSIIYGKIDNESENYSIPLLTCDERTGWFKNRKHLIEISNENEEFLKVIESSMMVFILDDREPRDISEVCAHLLDGNYQSKWIDKSVSLTVFRNGKYGCVGEHSSYDGPVSMSYGGFILESFTEDPEPNWNENLKYKILPKEIKFKIDEKIKSEIARVEKVVEGFTDSVTVYCQEYRNYGKNFMKLQKIHPDCFVQMALQLAYFKIHQKLAPTYETATMRSYYHGRTETVRSCSIEVKEWLEKMYDDKASNTEKVKLFKTAANSQFKLMNDARSGKGFDRHLFAMWCIARENNIQIPQLYSDPLYFKSGGGGNFYLSTSTLGYSICNGCVAPMLTDGYGVFYTMLDNFVWIIITAFRESKVTSSKKFYEAFESAMNEISQLLEATNSKL